MRGIRYDLYTCAHVHVIRFRSPHTYRIAHNEAIPHISCSGIVMLDAMKIYYYMFLIVVERK